MSRKNFTCPTCGAKLNTDYNSDMCHVCGTDVREIVDDILTRQAEDGPCGDCADDVNSPYYQGSIDDLYNMEDNGGDADAYYEDYSFDDFDSDDYDDIYDGGIDSDDYEEIYDDDAVLDNDYYDDVDFD